MTCIHSTGKLYLYYGTACSEDNKVFSSSSMYDGISNRTSSSIYSDVFQSATDHTNLRSSVSMDQAKEAVDSDESNATNTTIFAMGAEFGNRTCCHS